MSKFSNTPTSALTLPLNFEFDPLPHGYRGRGSFRRKRDALYKITMAAKNVGLENAMTHQYNNFVQCVFYSSDEAFIFIDAERMVLGDTVMGMPGYDDGFIDATNDNNHMKLRWHGAKTMSYNFANRTLRLLGRNTSDDPIRYLGKMTLLDFSQRVDDSNPARAVFQLDDVTPANMHILPH